MDSNTTQTNPFAPKPFNPFAPKPFNPFAPKHFNPFARKPIVNFLKTNCQIQEPKRRVSMPNPRSENIFFQMFPDRPNYTAIYTALSQIKPSRKMDTIQDVYQIVIESSEGHQMMFERNLRLLKSAKWFMQNAIKNNRSSYLSNQFQSLLNDLRNNVTQLGLKLIDDPHLGTNTFIKIIKRNENFNENNPDFVEGKVLAELKQKSIENMRKVVEGIRQCEKEVQKYLKQHTSIQEPKEERPNEKIQEKPHGQLEINNNSRNENNQKQPFQAYRKLQRWEKPLTGDDFYQTINELIQDIEKGKCKPPSIKANSIQHKVNRVHAHRLEELDEETAKQEYEKKVKNLPHQIKHTSGMIQIYMKNFRQHPQLKQMFTYLKNRIKEIDEAIEIVCFERNILKSEFERVKKHQIQTRTLFGKLRGCIYSANNYSNLSSFKDHYVTKAEEIELPDFQFKDPYEKYFRFKRMQQINQPQTQYQNILRQIKDEIKLSSRSRSSLNEDQLQRQKDWRQLSADQPHKLNHTHQDNKFWSSDHTDRANINSPQKMKRLQIAFSQFEEVDQSLANNRPFNRSRNSIESKSRIQNPPFFYQQPIQMDMTNMRIEFSQISEIQNGIETSQVLPQFVFCEPKPKNMVYISKEQMEKYQQFKRQFSDENMVMISRQQKEECEKLKIKQKIQSQDENITFCEQIRIQKEKQSEIRKDQLKSLDQNPDDYCRMMLRDEVLSNEELFDTISNLSDDNDEIKFRLLDYRNHLFVSYVSLCLSEYPQSLPEKLELLRHRDQQILGHFARKGIELDPSVLILSNRYVQIIEQL